MNIDMNLDQNLRAALAAILADLAQSLATHTRAGARETAGPVIFEDRASDGFVPTQWPRLSADIQEEVAKLQSHDFESRFRPGREIYLYVAGSTGLSQLAKTLQLPLFKIGLSAKPDLLTRQNELRADCYGSVINEDGEYAARPGFDDWEIRQSELRDLPQNPIIASMPRALKLRLPKGMSLRQFEKQLHQKLASICLYEWSKSPQASAHFRALRADYSLARRFTAYQFGSETRYSAAQEIYICRPRNDLAKVAALSMQIISGHVLAKPASKPASKSIVAVSR
jgi:hypothetical protein